MLGQSKRLLADAVEGKRSLQDRPKPLHYAENKQRFARFASKIIHVALDEDPQDKARYRWPVCDHSAQHQSCFHACLSRKQLPKAPALRLGVL